MRLKSGIKMGIDVVTYETMLGDVVTIPYKYSYNDEFSRMYVDADVIWYMFDTSYAKRAKAMEDGMKKVDRKEAAARNVQDGFPEVLKKYRLKDGGVLLAVARPLGTVPLALLEHFTYADVVSIVSTLEDMVCVLENGKHVHGLISTESLFVNPETRQCYLLGGWWNVHIKKSAEKICPSSDLTAIRELAGWMLGRNRSRISKEFEKFLNLPPAENAIEDQKNWKQIK